jgi:predicted  nucleic acid-binding Zn-ribbon protein
MEWWQTALQIVVVPLLVASVPVALLFILQRRGANKKLEIEEGGLTVTQFNAQTLAYQDLLDRAGVRETNALAQLADAVKELAQYKEERVALMAQVEEQGRKIDRLERADDTKSEELADTRKKLETLRALFETYVARTGIPMTSEEQRIFEDTKPRWLINNEIQKGGTA